ncbi:hypothetical protein [Rhizobium leguminosarum]|uniref:hypothetical protein n=1 Tax=Rhizobium leguminosarum TaxID=384 RepID=UPI001C9583BC|nr:hypothetical protein [Rhizobium leguminosarum]MBY5318217.1 hypothetical protein [Rhizobium leguminosarum]
MSDSIPSSEYIQIVRELATLGTKIDNFFSAQNSMKTEIDSLKKDISAVKSDVIEIKTQRRITMSNLALLTVPAGGIGRLTISFASSAVVEEPLHCLFRDRVSSRNGRGCSGHFDHQRRLPGRARRSCLRATSGEVGTGFGAGFVSVIRDVAAPTVKDSRRRLEQAVDLNLKCLSDIPQRQRYDLPSRSVVRHRLLYGELGKPMPKSCVALGEADAVELFRLVEVGPGDDTQNTQAVAYKFATEALEIVPIQITSFLILVGEVTGRAIIHLQIP